MQPNFQWPPQVSEWMGNPVNINPWRMMTNRIWGPSNPSIKSLSASCCTSLTISTDWQLTQPFPHLAAEPRLWKCKINFPGLLNDCFYWRPHWFPPTPSPGTAFLHLRWKITRLRDFSLVRGHSELGCRLPVPNTIRLIRGVSVSTLRLCACAMLSLIEFEEDNAGQKSR